MKIQEYYKKLPLDKRAGFMKKLSEKTGLTISTVRNVIYGNQLFGRFHYKAITKLTNNKVKLKDLRE